jgi:hypothetical protein
MKNTSLALLLFLTVGFSTLYAQTFKVDGIRYNVVSESEKTIEVVNSPNYSGKVTIPEQTTFRGTTYTVVGIGREAFWISYELTEVVIPNTVMYIEFAAFTRCTSLTKVSLGNSLVTIGPYAFGHCALLESIEIPNSVTRIEYAAFQSCISLQSVVIPNSVTSLGNSAFKDCSNLVAVSLSNALTIIEADTFSGCTSLQSIEIPNSVTIIDSRVFNSCNSLTTINLPSSVAFFYFGTSGRLMDSLTDIHVDPDNMHYSSVDGVLYNKDGSTLLYCPKAKAGELILPNTITSIQLGAFSDCSGIPHIFIPNSLNSISGIAGCPGLLSVSVSDDNQNFIAIDGVLYNSDTTELLLYPKGRNGEFIIPHSVRKIGDNAFSNCTGLTSVVFGNAVEIIGTNAFSGCTGLVTVEFSETLVTIGYSAFSGCTGIEIIEIPNSVTVIGAYAFYRCEAITSVTFGNSVETIGDYAFQRCNSLKEIEIPHSVTTIGVASFYGCYNLQSVIIGASVAKLGNGSFQSANLRSVTCHAIIPPDAIHWVHSAYLTYSEFVAYVPAESIDAYTQSSPWRMATIKAIAQAHVDDIAYVVTSAIEPYTVSVTHKTPPYSGDVVIPEHIAIDGITYAVTGIETRAFDGCNDLTSVVIGNEVLVIPSEVFFDCNSLSSVIIGNKVDSIMQLAIDLCPSLLTIEIPPAVRFIDKWAFALATDIQSINVDADNPNYTTIDGVLYNKNATKLIQYPRGKTGDFVIPNSVDSIGDYALYGCAGLSSVTFGDAVTFIGESAFENCSGLRSAIIGNSVKTIGDYAFEKCENLLSVTIGDSLETIGRSAFEKCSSLESIELPYSLKSLGNRSFAGCVSLSSIVIPDSVANLGYQAFYGCSNLSSVTIGNGITIIEPSTFYNCTSLESIEIPHSVTEIQILAFYNCSALQTVIFGNSLAKIGPSAFENCTALQSVEFGSSLETIDNKVFANCASLERVELPNSLKTIVGNVFYGCISLATVQYGDSVVSTGYAFAGCAAIRSLDLGKSMQVVGGFPDSKLLKTIVFPSSVATIGRSAFKNSIAVASITSYATTPPVVGNQYGGAFEGVEKTIPLFVPAESVALYKQADCWKDFYNIHPFPHIIDGIAYNITSNQEPFTVEVTHNTLFYSGSVSIPEQIEINGVTYTVTGIGAHAFDGSQMLQAIELPSTITTINENAFLDCGALVSITSHATTPPALGHSVFFGLDTSIPVYVPSETSVASYQSAEKWMDFYSLQAIDTTSVGPIEEEPIPSEIETTLAHAIHVYPNPFTESAIISFKNSGYVYALQLLDAAGNIIQSQETMGNAFMIERRNLPSGMYFYRVQNSTRSEKYKGLLVVE